MRGSCRTDNRACHRIRCVFYDLSLLFERWLELLMSVSGLQPVCGGKAVALFPLLTPGLEIAWMSALLRSHSRIPI